MVRILSPETRTFEEEVTADYNRVLRTNREEIRKEKERFDQKYGLTYPQDYVEFDEETVKLQEDRFFVSTIPPTFKRSPRDNMFSVVRNPEGLYLLFQNPVYASSGSLEGVIPAKMIGEYGPSEEPNAKLYQVTEITHPALLEELADGRLKTIRKAKGKMKFP